MTTSAVGGANPLAGNGVDVRALVGLTPRNGSAPLPSSTGSHPAADASVRPDAAPAKVGVSLIIPARNEAENIGWVLEQIPDCVDEVILVDGDSHDSTVAVAERAWPGIRVVAQDGPGKGNALRTGFRHATGELVVMIDADGSMSPKEIPHYLHFLDNGYDFVKGSRFISGGGSLDLTSLRRAGNYALLTAVRSLYRATITDLCYGFCAFRRVFLDSLDLQADGFEIETEMVLHALKAGLRIAEVPSLELPRRSGTSNLNTFRDGARVLNVVLKERKRPATQSLRTR